MRGPRLCVRRDAARDGGSPRVRRRRDRPRVAPSSTGRRGTPSDVGRPPTRPTRSTRPCAATGPTRWSGDSTGSGRRVLLVPAFPAAGRTCVGGVVLVDGAAREQRRARRATPAEPVRSSRPSDHLRQAGADVGRCSCPVTPCRRGSRSAEGRDRGVRRQHRRRPAHVVSQWAGHRDVVLAGTAATIAPPPSQRVSTPPWRGDPRARSRASAPRLIVCAAASTPMARRRSQPAEVGGRDRARRPESDEGGDPAAVARGARRASAGRALDGERLVATVVLIGGDTAAAVLGRRRWSGRRHGRARRGVGRPGGESGPLVVTKPGGFGTRSTLVDLLAAEHSA